MNYIKLSDAVNELSVARLDDDRENFLRYMILSKQIMRDLKIIYLNDFKRVYLPINKDTNTVRLPLDFYRFRTISVIEDCFDRFGKTSERVIPLTLNPYINITPQEPITCSNSCNCEINHPVCQELSNYTLTEESIVDNTASPPFTGTRQTILKLCANGDIIKEVTEPVQKWVQGDEVCDYEIALEQTVHTLCDYDFNFSSVTLHFPVSITMTLNGNTLLSGSLANSTAMDSFFTSHGWTKDSSQHYSIASTSDIWGLDVIIVDNGTSPPTVHNLTLTRNCEETTDIAFPYHIVSYIVNGEVTGFSPADLISNQTEQDSFFSGLGFTKVDATHYTIEGASDVYLSIIIETDDSPLTEITLNFTQSNCENPLINDGFENQLFSDVLCNVTLKDCGCIEESESNISTITSCCSPYLNCCQTGQLNDWSGWSYVPDCCKTNSEQPFNAAGTYNLDEKNYLLYLDSVNASRILLSYDNDGSCDSEFLLPDYCAPALIAGIAFKHAQYNEEFNPVRRRELEINYKKELRDMQRFYTDPIHMPDLINSLKTRKYPY